jgi:hypothetical protein
VDEDDVAAEVEDFGGSKMMLRYQLPLQLTLGLTADRKAANRM